MSRQVCGRMSTAAVFGTCGNALCLSSQRNSFPEDSIPEVGRNPTAAKGIDVATQQRLQIQNHVAPIQQALSRGKVDQQVNITCRSRITSRNGVETPAAQAGPSKSRAQPQTPSEFGDGASRSLTPGPPAKRMGTPITARQNAGTTQRHAHLTTTPSSCCIQQARRPNR